MKTSEGPQKGAHQPAAQPRKGTASLESPQGEQLTQLEAMAEASPQVDGLAQLAAIANDNSAAAAQRRLIDGIHSSPYATAQRQQLDGLAGETAQREEAPAKPNNTGLPDNLKSGIESLSGISMDNVKVHYNSSQPAQLNALAYAQGTDIHVAPGQEQHLPHEAWHVVQQKQGRVKPTLQMKTGIQVNNDAPFEHEADVMGARAIQGTVPPGNNPGARTLTTATGVSAGIVQRVIESEDDQRELLTFLKSFFAEHASAKQIDELHAGLVAGYDNLEAAKAQAMLLLKGAESGGLEPAEDTAHGRVFPQYPIDTDQIAALEDRRVTGTVPDGNCAFTGFIESTGLGIDHEALRALALRWVSRPLNQIAASSALHMDVGELAREYKLLLSPGRYGPLGLTALQHMFLGVVRIDVMTAGGHIQAGPGDGIPVTLVQAMGVHPHFYGTTGNAVELAALGERLELLHAGLAEDTGLTPEVEEHVARSSALVSEIVRQGGVEEEGIGKAKQNVANAMLLGDDLFGGRAVTAISGDYRHDELRKGLDPDIREQLIGVKVGRYGGKALDIIHRNSRELEHPRHTDSEAQILDHFLLKLADRLGTTADQSLTSDEAFDMAFPPKTRETVGGVLVLYTDRTPCVSCYTLLSVFRRDFPHISILFVYSREYGMVNEIGRIKTTRIDGQTFFYCHEPSASSLSEEARAKLNTAEQIDTDTIHGRRDAKRREEEEKARRADEARKQQSREDKARAAEFRAQQEAEEREALEQAHAREQSIRDRRARFGGKAGREEKASASQTLYDNVTNPPYGIGREHALYYLGKSEEFKAWWAANNSVINVLAELYQFIEDWDIDGLFREIATRCGYKGR